MVPTLGIPRCTSRSMTKTTGTTIPGMALILALLRFQQRDPYALAKSCIFLNWSACITNTASTTGEGGPPKLTFSRSKADYIQYIGGRAEGQRRQDQTISAGGRSFAHGAHIPTSRTDSLSIKSKSRCRSKTRHGKRIVSPGFFLDFRPMQCKSTQRK